VRGEQVALDRSVGMAERGRSLNVGLREGHPQSSHVEEQSCDIDWVTVRAFSGAFVRPLVRVAHPDDLATEGDTRIER
jgi:hypothetical protein